MQIKDQVAFVTGGASGLGAASSELLASLGAKVLIVDRDEARGQAKAKEPTQSKSQIPGQSQSKGLPEGQAKAKEPTQSQSQSQKGLK